MGFDWLIRVMISPELHSWIRVVRINLQKSKSWLYLLCWQAVHSSQEASTHADRPTHRQVEKVPSHKMMHATRSSKKRKVSSPPNKGAPAAVKRQARVTSRTAGPMASTQAVDHRIFEGADKSTTVLETHQPKKPPSVPSSARRSSRGHLGNDLRGQRPLRAEIDVGVEDPASDCGSDGSMSDLSEDHENAYVSGDPVMATSGEEPLELNKWTNLNRLRKMSLGSRSSASSRSSGIGFFCAGSETSSLLDNLGPAEVGLHGELRALEERQAAQYGSAHDVVMRPRDLRDMYAERLKVFVEGVNAIRDANEVVNAQRLRPVFDAPEPRTGSYLITAVKQRKLDAIRVLTGNHPTLKVEDSRRNVVNMAHPNVRGQLGRTALYEACLWGDPDAVSMLLKYQQGWHLPFESESGIGPLPLHLGLSDNTDVSPLMVAVQQRHTSVVALLTSAATAKPHPNVAVNLRAWPSPNSLFAGANDAGMNSITSHDLTGQKLGRGTDIVNARDMKGQTALLMACNMDIDNLEIVQHLLQAQADVGISDQSGMSPLHYACQRLHAQLVPLLLQQSASPNAKDTTNERTPLHYATNHNAPSVAMVNTLLAANADIGVRDKDGNTPLHLLFLKKRALLPNTIDSNKFFKEISASGEQSSMHYKLSALEETVNLILTRATQRKGADYVTRLLSLTNHKDEMCFGPEDKQRHFEYMRTALKDAVGTAAVGGSEAPDDELFQDILTQQSVDAKWTETCHSARMRQGLFFCALLFVFSVVAVVRAGATDQGSSVKSSFLAIFLNGRFSQEFQPNTADDNFPGNSLDNNHQDIPFADVASASESLEYFARLLDNLNAAALVETTSMNPESAQFSSWAVGMVLGAPILKQWRVDTTYVADNNSKSAHSGQRRCAVSPKLVVQPPCAQGFASTSLRDMPANLPHKSVLAAAYTWRALPGDLPWKVGEDNDEYPAGAYSLELPLVNAAVQTGTPFQENNVNDVELNAAELVRTLASHGWADSATRGISLEVAFYNPSRNRLSAVQLLAELRDGVGVRAEHRLRMHKVNTWNFRPSPAGGKKQVFGQIFKILEVVAAVIIPYVTLRDIYDNRPIQSIKSFLLWLLSGVRRSAEPVAFAESEHFFKLMLDFSSFALWGLIAYMEWQITAAVNTITWGPTRHYTSVQTLVAQISNQDALIALMMLTLSIKLVTSKLHAFRSIIILLKAIQSMIVALGNFFLVLIITYFAVGSAKYLVSPNSVGYFEAIIGEFWASVEDGGAMPEASENQSDYAILLLKILDIGRAVVVTMVLMNIITTMLTDSYSKVKDRAEAAWCKEQVIMILDEEKTRAKIAKQSAGSISTSGDSALTDDANSRSLLPLETSQSGRTRKRFVNAVQRVIRQINPMGAFSKHEYHRRVSISDLALHAISDARDKNNFHQAINDVIPELAFFVGDVRTPDGHEHNDKIAEKILFTFQGLRRCIANNVSMVDTFIMGGFPGNLKPLNDGNDSTAILSELEHFVMAEVGLERPVVVEAMLACLVYDQLGKVQLWRARLQQCIPNFYESIADQRVLLQALENDNRDHRARFLPSFASLQPEAQDLVVKAFQADFILGQFGQLECVPASLSRLQDIALETDGKQKLLFILFMQLLGIVGSPVFKGQLPLPIWNSFYKGSIRVIERLAHGDTPTEVYDALIKTAQDQMDVETVFEHNIDSLRSKYNTYANTNSSRRKTFVSFEDFQASLQKALLRLSKMLRLSKAADFIPLFDAALELHANELVRLLWELNQTGIDDGWAILLMYSPQLLLNVQNDKSSSELSKTQRLRVGLKALVYLYDMARRKVEKLLLSSDESSETSDGPGHDGSKSPGPNGIYEVNCYHLSTWATSTLTLQGIVDDWNRCISMGNSQLVVKSGEATVAVNPVISRKKRNSDPRSHF